MAAWLGVNPLRVCWCHVAQDLDLRFDHAERLRVRAADGSPTTLDHRRFADLLFPEGDNLFHEPIEIRIDRLQLRRIADEIRWHFFQGSFCSIFREISDPSLSADSEGMTKVLAPARIVSMP